MDWNVRHRHIIQLVSQFGQLTSAHITALIFKESRSRTSVDRALRRLVADGYLSRVERRIAGGAHGGSGLYVYQLGPAGHALHSEGRYRPARAVNFHSLAIADTYLAIDRLASDGLLSIKGYSTEPDCWQVIANNELKPDLYVELQRSDGSQAKYWLEVDMGTEGQRQVKDKLNRYWNAYNAVNSEEWPVWPLVVWVAVDDIRARELEWTLGQGSDAAKALFRITTIESLPTLLLV